eukprot:203585_1
MTPNLDELVKNGLELNRHYVHNQCGPTRSSFQSGRLPVYVSGQGIPPFGGIPVNMTTIATKFKQVNYSTGYVGKWHCGRATSAQTPKGRGWDDSLIYFAGSVDYYTHTAHFGAIDLWQNNKINEGPAYNLAGTKYIDFLFHDKVLQLLDEYSMASNPWFLVWSPHIAHDPLQVPKKHLLQFENDLNLCNSKSNKKKYIYPGSNNSITFHCRSIYLSMVKLLDKLIGIVINKLKHNQTLWDNTLVIFTSDNGGSYAFSSTASNNYPLRGAKHTPFEGGIRAAAFVSGGYLPKHRRGKISNAFIHIADWYTTFCEQFLGIDSFDVLAQKNDPPLHPIDGYNIWPVIDGTNESSPRTQLPISFVAIIQNEYKLIITSDNKDLPYKGKYSKICHSAWPGPIFPNSSTVKNWRPWPCIKCPNGCLFNLITDYTERIDVANKYPHIVQSMNNTLNKLKTKFYTEEKALKHKIFCKQIACYQNKSIVGYYNCWKWMVQNRYNGFHGPWCDIVHAPSRYIKQYDIKTKQPLIVVTKNILNEQRIMLFISIITIVTLYIMQKNTIKYLKINRNIKNSIATIKNTTSSNEFN